MPHIKVSVSQLFVAHINSYGKPCGSVAKNPPANATVRGDTGSIPVLGISPGEGNVYQLQYSSLQQYVNCELSEVQVGFRKGRGTRDQIANILWITKKARGFQKKNHTYFCFINYTKAFNCVDHNKLWKILKEMGIPDHLTCLLRNLYAGQETIELNIA